jgi:hypothetical protein
MTSEDRALLQGVTMRVKNLALELKMLNDRGYQVNFTINNITGESTVDIKQMVPIDLDADVQ